MRHKARDPTHRPILGKISRIRFPTATSVFLTTDILLFLQMCGRVFTKKHPNNIPDIINSITAHVPGDDREFGRRSSPEKTQVPHREV
jgi:hypothetical protein